jgi:predicted alpha/beta-fold hydrolase
MMMKEIILTTIITLITVLITSAQFDDKFYFPSKDWNEIENVNIKEFNFNIDEDIINTVLFKTEETPKATILFYHGAGGNISTYISLINPLVNSGYQVFAVDFRGYGKSTGKPTHINIANDAQIIIDKITTKEEFNNLPIIVYGASMGTQIATKIAKDNQNKISALILDGTISSFTDMALLSAPEEHKAMIAQYVTSPYSAKEDIKEIKNIPKLFIHSKQDASVPFIQGKNVFNNAAEPKLFWEYKGNHLDAVTNFPNEYIQKINNLLNL